MIIQNTDSKINKIYIVEYKNKKQVYENLIKIGTEIT